MATGQSPGPGSKSRGSARNRRHPGTAPVREGSATGLHSAGSAATAPDQGDPGNGPALVAIRAIGRAPARDQTVPHNPGSPEIGRGREATAAIPGGGLVGNRPGGGERPGYGDNLGIGNRPNIGNNVNRPNIDNDVNRPINSGNTNINRPTNNIGNNIGQQQDRQPADQHHQQFHHECIRK